MVDSDSDLDGIRGSVPHLVHDPSVPSPSVRRKQPAATGLLKTVRRNTDNLIYGIGQLVDNMILFPQDWVMQQYRLL